MKKTIVIVLASASLTIACANPPHEYQKKEIAPLDSLAKDSIPSTQEIESFVVFDTATSGLNFKQGNNYSLEKSKIRKQRKELGLIYQQVLKGEEQTDFLDSTKVIFTTYLLNTIIPYWYETVWDFNGYTSKPKDGTIACGYFVSTTLRDMGLKLNRYKLAQQGPENEAKTIAINASEVRQIDSDNIFLELKTFDDGLYFIGLDNHVGYLYIKSKNAYFIHSNYIEGMVMAEAIEDSEAFYSSSYYISNITSNNRLMEKWLLQEDIKVVME